MHLSIEMLSFLAFHNYFFFFFQYWNMFWVKYFLMHWARNMQLPQN